MAVQDLQSTSTSDYASPDYAFLNVAGGAILEPCGRHMRNRLDRILTDLLPRVPNCEDDIDIHVGGGLVGLYQGIADWTPVQNPGFSHSLPSTPVPSPDLLDFPVWMD